MKKETQRTVVRSLDETFERMMRAVLPNASARDMALAMQVWEDSPQVKRIKKSLAKAPDPNPEALMKAMSDLEQYVGLIRHGVEDAAKKMVRKRRGPEPTIPKDKWRELCAKLNGLHQIHPIRQAVRQIASEYGVGERTVYRIWGEREKLLNLKSEDIDRRQS